MNDYKRPYLVVLSFTEMEDGAAAGLNPAVDEMRSDIVSRLLRAKTSIARDSGGRSDSSTCIRPRSAKHRANESWS